MKVQQISILHYTLFTKDNITIMTNRIIMTNIERMYTARPNTKSWDEKISNWDEISNNILSLAKKGKGKFRETMGLTDEYVNIFCQDNDLISHCDSIKTILNNINKHGLNYFTSKINENIRFNIIYHAINLICTKIEQNNDIIAPIDILETEFAPMAYFMDNIKNFILNFSYHF